MSKSDKIVITVASVIFLTMAIPLVLMIFPIYLNDTRVELAYNKTYGKYKNLKLSNTHFDGTNQKVIIETEFEDIKDIDENQLIAITKEFMIECKKHYIPKKIESVWVIFTNNQGHSIGSMWTDRSYVKKVIWEEATNNQFKNVMNFR